MSNNVAIAMFGSAARGDADGLSDKDLLVVATTRSEAAPLLCAARTSGWHSTFYSWSRLRTAAIGGDLFVCHLQRESAILSDPGNTLAHLLSSFSPLGSYKERFSKAADVLRVLEHFPDSTASNLWALDVAAVAYRSLAVATLADRGIFAFSKSGLHRGLVRVGLLNPRYPDPYDILRHAKWLYRQDASAPPISGRLVVKMLRRIDEIFSLGAHFSVMTPEQYAVDTLTRYEPCLGWYARARRLEGLLLQLHTRDEEAQAVLRGLYRRLVTSTGYGFVVSQFVGQWEDQVRRIARGSSARITPGWLRVAA